MLGACVSQSTCEKQTAGLQQARAQEAAEQGQINKMRRSRNGSSPVTYCFRRASISSVPMANRHSTNTSPAAGPAERKLHLSRPPSNLHPACGGEKGGGYRPRRTMQWKWTLVTTAGGTAGAQQPPAAASPPPMTPPPVAPSSSASRPGIEEDAVTILKVWATIEEVRLAISLPLDLRFLAEGLSNGESDRRSSPCVQIL
jgi:hypothetical protein